MKPAVLTIIGHCGNEGQDQLPPAPHFWVHGAQLSVLPDDAGILLMQAHCLLDLKRLACTRTEQAHSLLRHRCTLSQPGTEQELHSRMAHPCSPLLQC